MATKGDARHGGAGIPQARLWLWLLLAAALITAAATAWVYGWTDRYQADGRSYLLNPELATAPGSPVPQGWELEGPADGIAIGDGGVRLTNRDPQGGIGLRQLVHRRPGDAATFRLSVTASTADVAGGERFWHGGRVTFTDRNEVLPHGASVELANLQGNRQPASFSHLFVFGSDTPAIELALRLRYATGTLAVRDLKLTGLVERPAFRKVADALRLTWALLSAAALVTVLHHLRDTRTRIAIVAAVIATAVVIQMPHSAREAIIAAINERLFGGMASEEFVARGGHLVLFATLGALVRAIWPRHRWALQFATLVLLAGATELSQLMADARSPSLLDWTTDSVGLALGLAVAWLVARRRLRPAA